MIRIGPSTETIQELNRILEQKPKMEEETDEIDEEQNEEQNEETTDEETSETEEESTDEEDAKRVLDSYKPNKISFLTLEDDYTTKIEKRDKPVIFGAGVCLCGGSITKANKARHIKSYRHQRYIDKLANE